MATSTGINPFFITHGYNTPLLDYDVAAAAGMENRGLRTPAEMRNEIIRKLREAFDFVEVVYFALLRPARNTNGLSAVTAFNRSCVAAA